MSDPNDDRQLRLAEYELWEKLEGRLWKRARIIGGLLIVLLVVVFLVGVPLLQSSVESRVRGELRQDVREQLTDGRVDIPALRRELRDDTSVLKAQLVENSLSMEKRLAEIVRQAEALEEGFQRIQKEEQLLQGHKVQLSSLQFKLERLKDEYETAMAGYDDIRSAYEDSVRELEAQIDRTKNGLPGMMRTSLASFERILQRELDELRMILTDHSAGRPAQFSTFLDLDAGSGVVTGSNFGSQDGRLMMRVRGFRKAQDKPVFESETLLMGAKEWSDSRIDLDLSPEVVAKLKQAVKVGQAVRPRPTQFTYGLVVMRSDGKMSQWSGRWAESIVPPEQPGSSQPPAGGTDDQDP